MRADSVSLNLPTRVASSVNCDLADAAGIDREVLRRNVLHQREPVVLLQLEG